MIRAVPLSDLLLTIAQGVPTQRYEVAEGKGGERYRVVQTRQMDDLYVGGELPELTLRGERLERHALPVGAVLVAIRTWPMKASVVSREASGALAGQNLAILTLRPHINPVFLAGLLRSGFMAEHLGVRASASGQPMLSLKQLQDVQVPLPPAEKQTVLADLFLDRERADHLTRRSTEQRQRVVEAALHHHLSP